MSSLVQLGREILISELRMVNRRLEDQTKLVESTRAVRDYALANGWPAKLKNASEKLKRQEASLRDTQFEQAELMKAITDMDEAQQKLELPPAPPSEPPPAPGKGRR